jgi:hypothetical protein
MFPLSAGRTVRSSLAIWPEELASLLWSLRFPIFLPCFTFPSLHLLLQNSPYHSQWFLIVCSQPQSWAFFPICVQVSGSMTYSSGLKMEAASSPKRFLSTKLTVSSPRRQYPSYTSSQEFHTSYIWAFLILNLLQTSWDVFKRSVHRESGCFFKKDSSTWPKIWQSLWIIQWKGATIMFVILS